MKRRQVGRLALAVAAALPFSARAQKSKVPVVAIFVFQTPQGDEVLPWLIKGLKDLGYDEGRNIRFEYGYAEGKSERFAEVAADLVRANPDVIVALGTDLSLAVRKATSTIPIVSASSGDPIVAGLAQSLAHPAGNVTGITLVFDQIAPRRLQYLKECAPAIRRVGFLWNPLHVDHEYDESQRAAKVLGVALVDLEVRSSSEMAAALRAGGEAGIDSLYVVNARNTVLHQADILQFAADRKIPVAAGPGSWAERGALLSYGPDLSAANYRNAAFVDKILKGARPGDLPIEQPTQFELIVNLNTAKQLGLTLPRSLLAAADKTIG